MSGDLQAHNCPFTCFDSDNSFAAIESIDGSLGVAASATLDITPVNDAPTTTPVTLTAIAEDSGSRVITQAELLANASGVDNASLTATHLAISAGSGTLVDNATAPGPIPLRSTTTRR